PCRRAARSVMVAIQLTVPGDGADHEGAQRHEAWPRPAHDGGKGLDSRARAGQQVLVDDEERLNRKRLSGSVADDGVAMAEFRMKSVLDDLVVSVVLALVRKCLVPPAAARELGPRQHRYVSARGRRLLALMAAWDRNKAVGLVRDD